MNWKFCTALIFITGFILFFSGCAKESADRLAQANNVCDTAAVKYSTQIVPILQDNCYSCHGNGTTFGSGGIALYTYAQLKGYADNGYLVGNVTHAPGYVAMPYQAPALPTCETEIIVAWVRQGAPNN